MKVTCPNCGNVNGRDIVDDDPYCNSLCANEGFTKLCIKESSTQLILLIDREEEQLKELGVGPLMYRLKAEAEKALEALVTYEGGEPSC